jgi:hypothetical protein
MTALSLYNEIRRALTDVYVTGPSPNYEGMTDAVFLVFKDHTEDLEYKWAYWEKRALQEHDLVLEKQLALEYCHKRMAEAYTEIEKLQKFKDYVHHRLDKINIPADPESPHKEAGCRIGGRLDIIESFLTDYKQWAEQMLDQDLKIKEEASKNFGGI